jgi:hypothetical protein
MTLCNCNTDNKRSSYIGKWDGCPIEGDGHTNFMLFRCNKCKGIIGFPDANLKIALEKGTKETKKKLAELIGS